MSGAKNIKNPNYQTTPSTKRDINVITPPTKEDKKSKMADSVKDNVSVIEMPDWAKKLATVDDFQRILDEFNTKNFAPFQKKIEERVEKMELELKSVPGQLNALENDFTNSIEFQGSRISDMEKKVDNIVKQNQELTVQVNNLSTIVKEVKKEKNDLKQKVIELEDRSRRDNLVIEGLEDSEKEGPAMCEKKARTFMKETLDIDRADDLVIGRVHRMGQYNKDKPRATIVKFDRYKDREEVWNKRSKVPKGKGLKENYSKETDKARSQLFPIMKAARTKGYFSKLEGNKLIVSKREEGINITCTVDSLENLPEDLKPENLFTPTQGNVTLFYTRHSPHSNFHKCSFQEGSKHYSSVEQYLVYQNAITAGKNSLANKVYQATDPAFIKYLGKDLVVDMDTKKEHMRNGMKLKYTQNQALQQLLKDTGSNTLGEANPYDHYWGTGVRMSDKNAFDVKKWKDNWAGKLLMEVRDDL